MTREELKARAKVRQGVEEFKRGVEQIRSSGQMTPEAELQVAEILARMEPLTLPTP
ncbi:MAG: hypothetical protein LBT57_03460 [Puniceicoccales bacterium]|jgi:hypothetical protein|nr:hypothetical protein [Puniceicoccales bacterium]